MCEKQQQKCTHFVIVCKKTAHFVCGTRRLNYCPILGLSNDFTDAKIFDTEEEAKETLENFMKQSPVKNQNKGDFDFQVVPVTITIDVDIPQTFKCKKCGNTFPIKKLWASTEVPRSWYTGMCNRCAQTSLWDFEKRSRGGFDDD